MGVCFGIGIDLYVGFSFDDYGETLAALLIPTLGSPFLAFGLAFFPLAGQQVVFKEKKAVLKPFFGKAYATVRLDRPVYYDVITVNEFRTTNREYVVFSNEPFQPYITRECLQKSRFRHPSFGVVLQEVKDSPGHVLLNKTKKTLLCMPLGQWIRVSDTNDCSMQPERS